MATHVKGLICLLNEYKKNHEASDVDGELIFSALFISAYTSGVGCLNIFAFFILDIEPSDEYPAYARPFERRRPRSR